MSTAGATFALARRRASILAGSGTLVLAVTIVAGALRLFRLGERGFWYDEIVTAYYARLATPGDVIDLVRYWGDHAPLAYLVTWALRALGGGEWAIRLHYAVAGTLAVYAMYLLGRALLGKSGGLLAALFMAVWPFAVYYGQEARPYTYFVLFTCLEALAAYRAVERGRPADWLLLALWSVLNLYTSYLALGVTAVCLAYIVLALPVGAWQAWRTGEPGRGTIWRRFGGGLFGAAACALVVVLVYLPWAAEASDFLARGDVGFGRYPPQPVTLGDLGRLLDQLGLTGLVLLAVVIGMAKAVGLVWRGRWRPGLLLILWTALPFAVLWWRLGPVTILLPPRYLMIWLPLMVLLAVLGLQVAAGWLGGFAERVTRRPSARRAAYTLTAVAVVIWMLPGLVGSYAVPKEQFREAAAYVMSEQPGPSTVLVVGEIGTKLLPPFVAEAIEYYFWLHHAPVAVLDGTRLDGATVDSIEREGRTPWLAVYTDLSVGKRAAARAEGFEVAPFWGVTFVRVQGGVGTPGEQLERLLDLGTRWYPQLVATRAALEDRFRDQRTGGNLLPPARAAETGDEAEAWVAGRGAQVDPASGTIALDTLGWKSEAWLTTRRLVPGRSYVLLFRTDNTALAGKQMVYMNTKAADGRALEEVPTWRGYECRRDDGSGRQGIAFTVPDGTVTLTIRLVAEGQGRARVWDVELRPMR